DFTGHVSISGASTSAQDVTIQLGGNGAISNGNVQEDETLQLPEGLQTPGSPSSLTISEIIIGQNMYIKLSGLGSQGEDKWYVTDLSKMGGQSGFPGMAGSNLTGFDPKYAPALQSQEVGKETVNGAATTKYLINVDMK